jgi:TM2 domain-containing membrane protein YozV
MESSDKSRLAALLFAFFLGTLGIHRFYVGKTGTAIVMLLFTITFFGILVSGTWALIDAITIAAGAFRDKNGLKITKWETAK